MKTERSSMEKEMAEALQSRFRSQSVRFEPGLDPKSTSGVNNYREETLTARRVSEEIPKWFFARTASKMEKLRQAHKKENDVKDEEVNNLQPLDRIYIRFGTDSGV